MQRTAAYYSGVFHDPLYDIMYWLKIQVVNLRLR